MQNGTISKEGVFWQCGVNRSRREGTPTPDCPIYKKEERRAEGLRVSPERPPSTLVTIYGKDMGKF